MSAQIISFPRRQRGHMDLTAVWWIMLGFGCVMFGAGAWLVLWALGRLWP